MNIEEIQKNKLNNLYYQNSPKMFEQLLSLIIKYQKSCCKVLSQKINATNKNFDLKQLISWIFNQTNHFNFDIKIQTRVFCIVHGIISIDQFPKCKTCGKPLVCNVYTFDKGFVKTYCNAKCRANNSEFKSMILNDRMKKYGGMFGNPKKIIETRIKHHGRKNQKLSESLKRTYQNRKDEIEQKKRNTLFKNYGVTSPMHSSELRSKHNICIYYDKKKFDSMAELAFYIWLKDSHINFLFQPGISFEYIYNEKTYMYFPDFKIGDLYFEIKGDHFFKDDGTMQNPYDHSQDELYEAKHQCMLENNVVIMRSNEYCMFEEYVKQQYGCSYLKQFKCKLKSK